MAAFITRPRLKTLEADWMRAREEEKANRFLFYRRWISHASISRLLALITALHVPSKLIDGGVTGLTSSFF